MKEKFCFEVLFFHRVLTIPLRCTLLTTVSFKNMIKALSEFHNILSNAICNLTNSIKNLQVWNYNICDRSVLGILIKLFKMHKDHIGFI